MDLDPKHWRWERRRDDLLRDHPSLQLPIRRAEKVSRRILDQRDAARKAEPKAEQPALPGTENAG